jgi:hypothetical protein
MVQGCLGAVFLTVRDNVKTLVIDSSKITPDNRDTVGTYRDTSL